MAAIATGTAVEGAGQGFMGLLDCLVDLSVPLLAAVNGVAVGLGFTLLPHCNLVLVDAEARLRVPFAELGVPPEAASSLLFPALMGWQQAARVLLTSDWVSAPELVELGLALKVCDAGSVLDETVALAARIAAHPRGATRASSSLVRAARREAVVEANRREQGALRRAARRRGRRAARWPNSPPGPAPDPDRAPRHHRRADRSRPGPGRPRRRGRSARLRLALPARAHPSPRRGGHAARAGRRRAPRRLQALPRPARGAGHGRRRDVAHRARHRHSARRPARADSAGQAGGHAGPSLRRARHARRRVRLEPHRGRGPRGRMAPPARRRARAPGGHGGHLVQRPGRVPRRVRRLRAHVVLAEAGAATAGTHARRRRRERRRARGGGGVRRRLDPNRRQRPERRPSRACTRSPSRPDAIPLHCPSSPSGPSPIEGKLEHYAALGITEVVLRVRAGDEQSVRAELESLAPLVPFAATLEQP